MKKYSQAISSIVLYKIFLESNKILSDPNPNPYSFWKNPLKRITLHNFHILQRPTSLAQSLEQLGILLQSLYPKLSPPLPILKSPVTPPSPFPALTKPNSFFTCLFLLLIHHLTTSYINYHTTLQTSL